MDPWPDLLVVTILFLSGSIIYVWFRIMPGLEYHRVGPYFFTQKSFLEPFLHRPGGLAEYAGIFLSQMNCQNWMGALLFLLLGGAIFIAALITLFRISGRAPGFPTLVPVFVLLLLRNRYGVPVSWMSIGLLLALLSFLGFTLKSWQRHGVGAVISGVISSLLFALAGLWTSMLFAVLCCLWMVIQKRNWFAGGGSLILALVAPGVAVEWGEIPVATMLNPWPEGASGALPLVFYASVPVTALILAIFPGTQLISRIKRSTPWFQRAWFGYGVVTLVLLLGSTVVWMSFDPRQKLLAEIDYKTSLGRFDEALAAARQVNRLDDPAMIRLHLALYHTGRLAEDLFSFHNMIEVEPSDELGEGYRAQTQSLLDLGLINDAEHTAYEALELEGNRPDLLRLLARINLLKDQPEAAQIFLNMLSLLPFQGGQVQAAWPPQDPPLLAEADSLASIRGRMLTNDVVHEGLPLERLLDVLLEENPSNQMAFEYAMAFALMDLNLAKAVEIFRHMGRFNYPHIPRSYEEALLLYQQRTGKEADLQGRTIRPETLQRFQQFKEGVQQVQGRSDAHAWMAAHFGDTYWYYFAVRSRERAARGQSSAL